MVAAVVLGDRAHALRHEQVDLDVVLAALAEVACQRATCAMVVCSSALASIQSPASHRRRGSGIIQDGLVCSAADACEKA